MSDDPLYVLIHSPLVGPYTWMPVADALKDQGKVAIVPDIREHEGRGPPYWQRHIEATREGVTRAQATSSVVVVGHSGAGLVLPPAGESIDAPVRAYIFVDSDIPGRSASRLDAMPREAAEHFRNAAQDGMLPPWPESLFGEEITDPEIRKRLVGEFRHTRLVIYEEVIPLSGGWPDAPCAYIQLSERYPHSVERARRLGWPIKRFEADHFFTVVDPYRVATALIELTQEISTTT